VIQNPILTVYLLLYCYEIRLLLLVVNHFDLKNNMEELCLKNDKEIALIKNDQINMAYMIQDLRQSNKDEHRELKELILQ